MASSVAIVGGGISGLAATYHLERALLDRDRPAKLVLFEATDRLGGVIRTERLDGFVIDAGPDSLLTEPPAAVNLCRELGLEDELVAVRESARRVWIYNRGRLRPMPSAIAFVVPQDLWSLVRSGLLSWAGLVRAGLEPFVPRGPDRSDESLAEFFGRRLGREVVDRIVEPLLAGIYAGDVDRLSVAATFPRFREVVRRHGSLIRGMRKARSTKARPGRGRPVFLGLGRGLDRLVEALARGLERAQVRTRAPVRRVGREGSGAYELFDARGTPLGRFDALVLAIPAYRAAELLRSIDPSLAEALAAVPYVSTATVALAYDRRDLPRVPSGHGFFIPGVEGHTVRGATFVSSKYEGRSPADRFLLRAFVGGWGREGIVAREETEIVAAVRAELAEVLGWEAEPRLARVFRYEKLTPQYEVGHVERLARIAEAAAKHPGLALTGNAYRGIGIPACVADGRRAAEETAAFLRTR